MKKKLYLSSAEQQEHNANAIRLRTVGTIPQQENPSFKAQMLILEQTSGPTDSVIHEPLFGGYGIAIWVRIVALKSEVSLCDCQITPKQWDDTEIFLVSAVEGARYCKMPDGAEYPRNNVLNCWISSARPLRKRQVVEGVIIAQSFESLPEQCKTGTMVEVELSIIDQLGTRYPLRVELIVTRDQDLRSCSTEVGKTNSRPAHYSGLYAPSATSKRMYGVCGENADRGVHATSSPTEADPRRANGAFHVAAASPGVGSKRMS